MVLPLESQTNHLAEAIAAYHSLRLARQLNYTHVWIEGDSNNIIQCLKGKQKPSWSISYWIEDSIDIIRSFKKYYISHIYREGNGVTDLSTNYGVKRDKIIFWNDVDRVPEDVGQLVAYERLHAHPTKLT